MISTTLSRVQDNLTKAGVSATALAMVAGIPPSTVNSAFRSLIYLGSEREAALYKISCRVLEVVQALRPLVVDKSDWPSLKNLVDGGRSGVEIHAAVSQIFEEVAP